MNFDEMKESEWIDLSQYERPTEDALLNKGKLRRKGSQDSNWSHATSLNDT